MAKYAKAIVAVITAALVAVSTYVAPDTTWGKGIAVALAILGAAGVYLTPNKPADPPPAA